MRRHAVLIWLSFALVACADDRPITAASGGPGTTPAPSGFSNVGLTVSRLKPDAGSVIGVAASITGDSLSVGSFLGHLTFDVTKLKYLADVDDDGMMRVVNPQAGDIAIAAASTSATSGRLFTFRFLVEDPAGVASLRLTLEQLSDLGYANRLPTVRATNNLSVDSSLGPAK
jgi:hypothetical protein